MTGGVNVTKKNKTGQGSGVGGDPVVEKMVSGGLFEEVTFAKTQVKRCERCKHPGEEHARQGSSQCTGLGEGHVGCVQGPAGTPVGLEGREPGERKGEGGEVGGQAQHLEGLRAQGGLGVC